MGESVRVKIKYWKIKTYTKNITGQIKTTLLEGTFSGKQEQPKHSPLSENNGVTATAAVIKAGPKLIKSDWPLRQTNARYSKPKN